MKNITSKVKKAKSWEMSHETFVGLFIGIIIGMVLINLKRSYKSIARSLKDNVLPDDSVFEATVTGLINLIQLPDTGFSMEILILFLFSLALVIVYILIFYGAIKFLLSYSKNTFRFSLKSVTYLKILGGGLTVYAVLLIFFEDIFLKVGIFENSRGVFESYGASAQGNFAIISALFIIVFASLLSRSAELQIENEGTI